MNPSSRVLTGLLAFLTILAVFLFLGAPYATAQNSGGTAEEVVKVVGHLPLEGMHVNQMFVLQRGQSYFLYLHRPAKESLALADVSEPTKPLLLSRNALKASAGIRLEPPAGGSVLALTDQPEANSARLTPASAPLPTETVQLVDLSDPSGPKVLKTFHGVTSLYPEDGRKLVYLVDSEGLWILSHHLLRPVPLCTSRDALSPMPNCQ